MEEEEEKQRIQFKQRHSQLESQDTWLEQDFQTPEARKLARRSDVSLSQQNFVTPAAMFENMQKHKKNTMVAN